MQRKTTELMPFQKEGIRKIYQFHGRALLADQMGLGKSLQALSWIQKIPSYRPAVIVCPCSMKYTWQAEALLHLGMRTDVLEGKWNGRRPLPGNIVILNYDILGSWLPLLLQHRPQVVILDEVHFIKSLRAKRTKAAIRLCDGVPSVVGLSGTPLTNRPSELWPVLRAIRPDIFPNRNKYYWRYCQPKYTIYGWKYDGATNMDELHSILKQECMIRRLKKQVLSQLPDKQRRFVCFPLQHGAQREYEEAKHNFIKWLKKMSPTRAKRAERAKALAQIGYLVRLSAQLKLEWTKRWISEFFEAHPGEKLVAFTMHTSIIDSLQEHFGSRCIIVDGRVTGRKRHESVRQFQSHPKKDLFLGNWVAAGVGITLTAASNFVALDLPWTPGDLLQGEDRIHRIGAKKTATIHYLTLLDTIEEKQISILRSKVKVLDAVLDGKSSSNESSILEELLNEFRRKA